MPTILDAAIGTLFVFLLFSLIVSATVELGMAYFDQRSKYLRIGLTELLGADRVEQFLKHGLINALSKPDTNGRTAIPSYIAPGAFATAVFDLIVTGWADENHRASLKKGPLTIENLAQAIEALPASETKNDPQRSCLRQALLSLFLAKDHTIDSYRLAVEGWFNDAMDRVGGWYKKHSQFTLLIVGFVLAIVLHVDTIHIVQTLSTDPKLREAVIKHAAASLQTAAKTPNPPAAAPSADAQPPAAPPSPEQTFRETIARLGEIGIPIGWSQAQCFRLFPGQPGDMALRLPLFFIGCFITALAGSLGAPFWFDLLGRFMNVRAAGRSPIEKSANDSTPIKDLPTLSKF